MPRKGARTGVYVACENCGKIVYKTQTNYKRQKHHYCSNTCQFEVQHRNAFEIRNCEICGKPMELPKKSTQRFCSYECQSEWQRGNVGFKNPKFEGGKVKCTWCGKPLIVGKYKLLNLDNHFCNDDCRRQWYSNVWSQSDEWKDESRKRATRILNESKRDTNTKPQVIVNDILKNLGINYRNEEPFVYYSMDNYLYDYDLAIEVMGDFWHCSPIVYNEPIHEIQRRRIGKDKAKKSYIKKYHNINILYLWEKDIYNNRQLCEQLILKYIETNGVLDNYNSFNYKITENGVLELKDDIILPFYERTA